MLVVVLLPGPEWWPISRHILLSKIPVNRKNFRRKVPENQRKNRGLKRFLPGRLRLLAAACGGGFPIRGIRPLPGKNQKLIRINISSARLGYLGLTGKVKRFFSS
jgi:hypothetical protein